MADFALLDNVAWHALTGPQARFAAGEGAARRYAKGFSPIVGFANAERPDFAAMAGFCEPGEHFYCEGGGGRLAPGWRVDEETTMFKMVWDAAWPAHDPDLQARPLEARHASQAFDLAALTRPGPFGPRTIELGEYLGIFEGERLVAMAGERMQAGRFREISGVCTVPEREGRGWARRLMLELVRRQLRRGEIPFLHVMRGNARARGLYARMGFREYREVVVRVISPE
jgi:ribosomal protein S18 acetylase RimI-like enzyme